MTFSNVEQVNVAIGDNASVIVNPGELILLSSKGGTYRLNFPFVHLVKEMYGEKVGQKWMDNDSRWRR